MVFINSQGCGHAIVFLHGWGFNSQVWQALATSQLSKNYQLFCVDLPGFGHTPYMLWDEFSQNLLHQLPQRFAVVGWSMGGLMATRLALLAPERISHLVNIASLPYFLATNDWPAVDPMIFASFHRELQDNSQQTLHNFMALQVRGQAIPVMDSQLPSPKGLESGLAILSEWDLRKQLHALTMPTHYVFGRLDAITPYRMMTVMQQQFPQFYYHSFAKSAHAPFLSHQDEFIHLLQQIVQ